MTNYNEMSEKDLEDVLRQAEQALKDKIDSKSKGIIKQIHELADSINMTVILSKDKVSVRKGSTVAIKYRDPASDKTWTGRGVTPLWMKAYLDAGRDKTEFLV